MKKKKFVKSKFKKLPVALNFLASGRNQGHISKGHVIFSFIGEGFDDAFLHTFECLNHLEVNLRCPNQESRFFLMESVQDLHHDLGMSFHHFKQIRGVFIHFPVLVQHIEGLQLERFIVVQSSINIGL